MALIHLIFVGYHQTIYTIPTRSFPNSIVAYRAFKNHAEKITLESGVICKVQQNYQTIAVGPFILLFLINLRS